MKIIRERIKDLGLEISDLKIYSMNKIDLGMKVDNQVRPIYIKHIPTDVVVIEENSRSHHKNLINGLEKLKREICNKE